MSATPPPTQTIFALCRCSAISLLFLLLAFTPALAAKAPTAPSLSDMVGQMIMIGFRGTEPESPEVRALLQEIKAGHVGGVILFDVDATTQESTRNIISVAQVKKLTNALQNVAPKGLPLFIGIDQEGGRVRRFKPEHGVEPTPAPKDMGMQSPKATQRTAYTLGRSLRAAGVNVNFAPSLDVDINPQSPAIGALGRSFSANPDVVIAQGRAFAAGLQAAGVLACYKHFPGHGSATADTHKGLADVTSTWQDAELSPYRALLAKNPPAMVMVGHMVQRNMDDTRPASLSHKIITELLRGKLGWHGIVITDDLQMGAIESHYSQEQSLLLAVNAGVDILLLGNNLRHNPQEAQNIHAIVMKLVADGTISPQRIKESYIRIVQVKKSLPGK